MVPNDGSSEVVNAEDVLRRIAFVKRGVVSLVEKAKHAQKAGARAVIIIDGNCTRAVDGLRCENEVEAKTKVLFSHILGKYPTVPSPYYLADVS